MTTTPIQFLRAHRRTTAALATAVTIAALTLTSCGNSGAPGPELADSPACQAISGKPKGHGPGNDATQLGVIAAFKYAFFAERDPAKAAGLTAPEAGVSAAAVRDAITSYPRGISYCFAITRVDGNAFWVSTHAVYPGETYRPGYQILTLTTTAPYRITAIYDRYQRL